jgi:hypothetical protein
MKAINQPPSWQAFAVKQLLNKSIPGWFVLIAE